jgi:penicillin-binding protein 1A
VYAQLIEAIGPERVVSFAQRLGITSELSPVLSLTLGTPSVSVLEMADTYLTFATRGMHVAPKVVVKVTDAKGRILYQPKDERARAMEEHEADVVTYALEQVVKRGTGTRAALRTPAAGKTGTTQSYGDAWFVGYTPGMSTAVWVGFPDGQDHELRGVHGLKGVTGGTLPADIWHRYMAVATEQPQYRGSFHDPGDLGGRLVPESSRVEPDASTTTTASPSSTTSSSSSTSSSSTTSTTAGGSDTTTTSSTEPTSTTTTTAPTTSTTVLPPG